MAFARGSHTEAGTEVEIMAKHKKRKKPSIKGTLAMRAINHAQKGKCVLARKLLRKAQRGWEPGTYAQYAEDIVREKCGLSRPRHSRR